MKNPIIRFLSSMNVAIALLVMLAIVSVIGTLIQQNQPYLDYSLKFGVFWFEVFHFLGLYNIYGEIWFLLVLLVLVVSVCFCVVRQAPLQIKQMKNHIVHQHWKHLSLLPNTKIIAESFDNEELLYRLKKTNYRIYPPSTHNDGEVSYTQFKGSKGKYQKMGYFLTHIGVIVIAIGALMDSSIMTKFQEWWGNLKIETRDIPVSEIDKKSWLDVNNHTYRGVINIPEGKTSNVVFLPWNEGYVVQPLPFYVQLLDFRTLHYPTGQPKSFESDLEIYNLDGSLRTTKTINVNNPLSVGDITIYQSSFQDGGSKLQLKSFNLIDQTSQTLAVEIFKNYPLKPNDTTLTLEMTDFRLFNIQPLEHNPAKFKNNGPSFHYKIRNASGQAIEYLNYMLPIENNGRLFFLSGVRRTNAEDFSYLYLPLDDNLSPNRFFNYLRLLNSPHKLNEIMNNSLALNSRKEVLSNELLQGLVHSFLRKGFEPIAKLSQKTEIEDSQKFQQSILRILELTLSEVYLYLLESEENVKINEVTEQQSKFFDDAIDSLASIHQYGSPIFLQLLSFKQIQSTGLQITRSFGKPIAYFGFLLLIVGILCMFYIPSSRLWVNNKGNKLMLTIDNIKGETNIDDELRKIIDIIKGSNKNSNEILK